MRIIAAIDIIGGKCVRLTKGDFNTSKIYSEDPVGMAQLLEDSGIEYLHLIDLDGAKNKRPENLKILENIATGTRMKIDFGGGLRTYSDLRSAFNAGADQVVIGSTAVTDPALFKDWLKTAGSDRIVLGADCIDRKIATNGWLDDSGMEVISFISDNISKGIRYVICTDISKDGMMQGPSTDLYREILAKVDVRLVASGGISSVDDVEDVRKAGCEGVIIGKAIYEGKITLKELKDLC